MEFKVRVLIFRVECACAQCAYPELWAGALGSGCFWPKVHSWNFGTVSQLCSQEDQDASLRSSAGVLMGQLGFCANGEGSAFPLWHMS